MVYIYLSFSTRECKANHYSFPSITDTIYTLWKSRHSSKGFNSNVYTPSPSYVLVKYKSQGGILKSTFYSSRFTMLGSKLEIYFMKYLKFFGMHHDPLVKMDQKNEEIIWHAFEYHNMTQYSNYYSIGPWGKAILCCQQIIQINVQEDN